MAKRGYDTGRIAGFVLIVLGVSVFGGLIPLSGVSTSAVTITGISVVCEQSPPGYCTAHFTLDNAGGAANPLQVQFKVGGAGCDGAPSCLFYYSPYSVDVASGASSAQTVGGWGVAPPNPYQLAISVDDASGNQVSQLFTYGFTATGTIGLTVNPPVDYVTGGSVAGCPTSPPKGSYQETYGSGVDVSTASCPGATFKFWYYTNAGNPAQILTYSTPSITFDMDQVTSVTPAFEQSTGPVCSGCITVTSEEYSVNATVSPLGDQTLQSGGSVTFTFEAPPGWTGWALYGGSAETLITSGTSSSVTLTYAQLSGYGFSSFAIYSGPVNNPNKKVTVSVSPGVGVAYSPSGSLTMTPGGSVTFTFSAMSGYYLPSNFGWSVYGASGVTGTGATATVTYSQLEPYFASVCSETECDFTIATSQAAETPLLNVYDGPGGSTTPAAGTYPETYGSSVKMTETPSAGFCFNLWTLDGNAAGNASTLTVDMTASHIVYANFFQVVNGICNPSGPGNLTARPELIVQSGAQTPFFFTTTPAAGTYLETAGAKVTITEQTVSGYVFCVWLVNGVSSGGGSSITVTIPAQGFEVVSGFTAQSGGTAAYAGTCTGQGGSDAGGGGSGISSSLAGPLVGGALAIVGLYLVWTGGKKRKGS